ncbi:MAG: hypothetical protein BPHS0_13 [Phage 5P_3]|nr:MAG: hypothetical protein BPHS0_13 [Phage 5P_3]
MSELTAIDKWLYDTLKADATLVALLASATAIYERGVLPQTATRPYVLYDLQTPSDVSAIGGYRIMTEVEATVRGVVEAENYSTARSIAARIDALLHRANAARNTYGLVLTCVRVAPLRGSERIEGGGRVVWQGGVYRIQCQL